MTAASRPDQIYERATAEGRRRLSLSTLDQVSTAFIAGVTIIFGVVALGVVEALVEPRVRSRRPASAKSDRLWEAARRASTG